MKRLLAAGSGDIYQICRVFRDDELGRWHQPEFTLLEWYRVGWDEQQLMTEVEALLGAVLSAATADRATPQQRARALRPMPCHGVLGTGPEAPTRVLIDRLTAAGIDVPPDLRHDAVLDLPSAPSSSRASTGETFTFVDTTIPRARRPWRASRRRCRL